MFDTNLNVVEASTTARQHAQGVINNVIRNIKSGMTATEVTLAGRTQLTRVASICKLPRDAEQLREAVHQEAAKVYFGGGLHTTTFDLINSL